MKNLIILTYTLTRENGPKFSFVERESACVSLFPAGNAIFFLEQKVSSYSIYMTL